jgi:CPA2 family monovalent cation:H+ antiporter-2
MEQLLITLGLMIVAGAIIALIAKKFKQPILLGYVLAGFIIGPAVLKLIPDAETVNFISDIGLIFLMFLIGLELDLSKLKDVGKISVIIGIIQVVTVTFVAAICAKLLGFTFVQGLYLGLVISF